MLEASMITPVIMQEILQYLKADRFFMQPGVKKIQMVLTM